MLSFLLCSFLHFVDDPRQAILLADQLRSPFAVAFDSGRNTYFVEYTGHRLGMLDSQHLTVYLAGTGAKGDLDGQPDTSALNSPHNLAIAPNGDIYLADTLNHKIKKYDPKTQVLSTFAGTGKAGFLGDGEPAAKARFNETYHVTLDTAGKNLYVVDLKNQRIRCINLKTQLVRTVAGNGHKGTPVEGEDALASPLNDPRAMVVDQQGQLYLLQRGGNDLWKVDTQGKLRRIAGTGKKGYSGDGEAAVRATLSGPKHLCFDLEENLLIADTDNHCIRRVNLKTGLIHLVAGRGNKTLPDRATNISLKEPHGVTVHPDSGDIYIADSGNNRIIKLVAK